MPWFSTKKRVARSIPQIDASRGSRSREQPAPAPTLIERNCGPNSRHDSGYPSYAATRGYGNMQGCASAKALTLALLGAQGKAVSL
jgi:hypothetical protein